MTIINARKYEIAKSSERVAIAINLPLQAGTKYSKYIPV